MNIYTKKIKQGEYCKYFSSNKNIGTNILYKYRDWNNPYHKTILYDNRIYLAPPSSFEDKFDCNIPESFPSLNNLSSLFWKLSFKEIPEANIKERKKWVKKWCKISPLANIQTRNMIYEYFKELEDKTFGILSLTANPYNEKMWKKYAAEEKGICIGLDSNKLFEVVGGGGPVIYTDKLPILENFKDDYMTQHIKRTFYKQSIWSFEEEYRLHKRWFSPPSNDDRNILMKEGTIIEVILGSKMSQEDKYEVYNIAKSKYQNIKIIEL